MPGLSFYSNNWPTFHHNTVVPPPLELSPFSFTDDTHFSNFNNGLTTNNNYLSFQNYPIKYPTLSSFNQITTHQCYSNQPFIPSVLDHEEFFQGQLQDNFSVGLESGSGPDLLPINTMEHIQAEYYSYPTHPMVPDVCSVAPVQPEIYHYGSPSTEMLPKYGFNATLGGERSGERRLSAQSIAARVRRRKISEKTLELGKLVPGGQRLTTAEMFQAAYKYIKFLQAQVGVLQLMSSSPELGSELQDLVTSPSVQEKLFSAGKCIVSQALAKTLADDHHEI